MPKVSFSRVENIFTQTVLKIMIDRLSELAAIVTMINNPESKLSDKEKGEILLNFQKELSRLKKHDNKLFQSLNITEEDEQHFFKSEVFKEFTSEDWKKLKDLKESIDSLKRQLYGETSSKIEEYEKQVEEQRLKHINKRHNIKDGWLPLR